MTDKPTKTGRGGTRAGAGRPTTVIRLGREFKLRDGAQIAIHSSFEDGMVTRMRLATVHMEKAPIGYRITIKCDDGETIHIIASRR